MNNLEKAKIKYISRMIIGMIVIILIIINHKFIKCNELCWVLWGFTISQFIEAVIDYIISSIDCRRKQKELFEKYPETKEWFKKQ